MRIQRSFSFEVATSLSVFIFGSHFRILVDFILSPGLVGNSVLITIGKFGKEPKGTEIDNSNINIWINLFLSKDSFDTDNNEMK